MLFKRVRFVFRRLVASENDYWLHSAALRQTTLDQLRHGAHLCTSIYPVNILETQLFAIAACPRNILFTISLIRSAEDTKKSRKSQYFLRFSDVECCRPEPVPVATRGPSS